MTDADSTEEMNRYLALAKQELSLREARLHRLDQEIAGLQQELDDPHTRNVWQRGNAQAIGEAEGFRRKVRGQLEQKRSERVEALRDVEMARERIQLVQTELGQS